MSSDREPTDWLNYRGDRRDILRPDHPPLGPNVFNELMYPVTATYDLATDRTRVGLSVIAPTPS